MTDWVFPEQVRRARETLGVSVPRAAEELDVSIEVLEGWEAGGVAPDDEQLWNLAETYGRPVGYFFARTTEPPRRIDYRARRPPSGDADLEIKRAVVARFEELCRMQVNLERLAGETARSALLQELLGELRPGLVGDALAMWLRSRLGLGDEPITNLESLLVDALAIRTFTVALPDDQVSGTSWWHPEFGPAILVNRKDPAPRRTFTMAHELGHLLHPEGQALCGFLSSGPNEETAANRFAAEFLLPSSGLATVVEQLVVDELLTGWHTPDRALERVARRYGVSREAASWRLEALEHLPSGFTAARRAIWSARPRYGQTRGARWQRRLSDLGVRHVRLAQQAFARSQISLGSLADALLIDIEQAYELTEATA